MHLALSFFSQKAFKKCPLNTEFFFSLQDFKSKLKLDCQETGKPDFNYF
jgi:hypothetical protein